MIISDVNLPLEGEESVNSKAQIGIRKSSDTLTTILS